MEHLVRLRNASGMTSRVGRVAPLALCAALATSCGSSTSSPTPPALDVSGSWSGTRTYEYKAVTPTASNDCHYTEGDAFTITQSGTSLSGSLAINFHLLPGSFGAGTLACATDNVCTGPFTGSITGTQVAFILAGRNCFNDVATFNGTVTGDSMSGTNSPNPGIFVDGSLTVTELFQPWAIKR